MSDSGRNPAKATIRSWGPYSQKGTITAAQARQQRSDWVWIICSHGVRRKRQFAGHFRN